MRRTTILGLAACLLALSGCGSDGSTPKDAKTPISIPSPSQSPVPKGVPTEVPTAPSSQSKTKASAEEFATYVFKVFEFDNTRRNFTELEGLVQPGHTCTACGQVKRQVKKLIRQGVFYVPDSTPAAKIVSGLGGSKTTEVVGVAYDLPTGKVLDQAGKQVNVLPAQPNSYMEVTLVWDKAHKRWFLQNFTNSFGKTS